MEWLASHALAIGSALLAAFWAALGIVVRQRAIQRTADNPEDSGAIVTSWVRQPSWWAGTLGAIGGYVFQALALAHGSLLLVQPLLVSSLLFVLPLGARFSNQLEQIFNLVASGCVCEFIREALDSKSVINIRDGSQPTDANVRFGRSVLDADVGKVVRNVRPTLRQMRRVPVYRVHIKG